MNYLFPELGTLFSGVSVKDTDVVLRDAKLTGLVEKRLFAGGYAVMVFSSGIPGVAYHIEGETVTPLTISEFSAVGPEQTVEARVIKLPDVAGRLSMLALESKPDEGMMIQNENEWNIHIESWRKNRRNALLEVRSGEIYGVTLIWQGELQASDMIFTTSSEGIVLSLPDFAVTRGFPMDVMLYSLSDSSQAYQYAVLRHGVMEWMSMMLARYKELVGSKLLFTMEQELNSQIHPWGWKINLNGTRMSDAHFFLRMKDAEQAYRALFMSMSMLMDIVIGSNLTLRLLNETYAQLPPEEQAVLHAMRLIPVAFSE